MTTQDAVFYSLYHTAITYASVYARRRSDGNIVRTLNMRRAHANFVPMWEQHLQL